MKSGRRLHEPALSAAVRPNEMRIPRLGLAISARAVPTAVARNRIKRQARESFRLNHRALPALDIVILARTGAARLANPQLRATLERLWTRIRETCAPR
jgi:ribonuclease P protein component